MALIISGIQQAGIGVSDVNEAWKFYRKLFSANIPVLNEKAEAKLMLPYTGGKPQERHAILAINIQGGGGFEIWQYTKRKPLLPDFEVKLGDLGINIVSVKSQNIAKAFSSFQSQNIKIQDNIHKTLDGRNSFYVSDPFGNHFQIIESNDTFSENNNLTGGVFGATIGVSDIEKAYYFYSEILGYDKVITEKRGKFEELFWFSGGKSSFRRMLLTHSKPRKGVFSELLGNSQIELIQVLDRSPEKIFRNRFWGDLGFIHLCFDVSEMDSMIELCDNKGFPVTVDSSANFEMGDAAGRFVYTEDPDGTLIEFVETFKIPILKKIGWFLDLRKRSNDKPLPRWMLKAMSLNKVKD